MSHGTLGAAVNQDQSIPTCVRERESQRLGDGCLALLCSDLSRCFRSKTNSGVLREAGPAAREAHGPHRLVDASRRWRTGVSCGASMASGPTYHTATETAGSYKAQVLRDAPGLGLIYRPEWAAYLSFRNRAAPSVFGSPQKLLVCVDTLAV